MLNKTGNFSEGAAEFLFSNLANGRNALIDAPPGLGKTRGAAKAAIRLMKEKGHRVVIIEPTKTLRSQVVNYLRQEDNTIEVHESKGWSDYECPLLGLPADPSWCSDRKSVCGEQKRECGVLSDLDSTRKSKLTAATFSKLLMSKALFSDYSTVLVDESHGFENAETSFLQTYVTFSRLREVADEVKTDFPCLAEKLSNLARGLSKMDEMLGDSTPLTSREADLIREELSDTVFRDSWLDSTRNRKFPRYRNLYSNMVSLRYRMENISNNLFFFYEGALFARPKSMEVEVSSFFRDKNVGLISATIDDAVKHAKACGLDMRRFTESSSMILTQYPETRRRNRKLIALTDGPTLSKAGGEEYKVARDHANQILLDLLNNFDIRTLVLFRSYNDQQLAWQYLEHTDVRTRVHNVWQGEDPDVIDEEIAKLRESDIVLTSASTRLWEGVDIPGLRLVIIDALPYPGKDPLDKKYNFKAGHETMTKKLKQGLGRIVRSDNDWGAAIIIDDRFYNRFSSLAPRLPWFMGEDFKKLSLQEAIHELNGFVSSLVRSNE